jgi:hypothetical protein
VERGVQPDPAQRYRARKLRNVMDHLPQDQNGQAKSAMRAAWKPDAGGGMGWMNNAARRE